MKICAAFVLASLCCSSVAAQRTVKDGNIEWSGNTSGLTVLKYKGMNVLGNGSLRPHGQITLLEGNGHGDGGIESMCPNREARTEWREIVVQRIFEIANI